MEVQENKMKYNYSYDFIISYIAKVFVNEATDLRTPIVAIITKDENILCYGTNQAQIKWKWLIELHKKYCLRKIFKTPKNRWYWFCPGCANHNNHAEINAIKRLKKIEKNMKLYLYGHKYCCKNCENKLKEIGINEVYII